MTDEELNLWERQPNVCRVLISREMGAWLKRRDENKAKQQPTVCDIDAIMEDIRQIVDAETEHDEKWARGLHYSLCVIEKHMKGEQE